MPIQNWEYKTIADSFCLTPGHKARKIERCLNREAAYGWEMAALNSVLLLGCDVGFYLVLRRPATRGSAS